MKQINLYIENTIAGGRAHQGATGYILEYACENGKTVTLSAGIVFDEATRNQAEIVTLIKAISRIGEEAYIKVYTDNTWIKSLMNGWLDKWKSNGWKRSDGQQIENADIISILSVILGTQEVIAVGDAHEYKKWLEDETRKAAILLKQNECECITIPYK